jgi:hypothetical protein
MRSLEITIQDNMVQVEWQHTGGPQQSIQWAWALGDIAASEQGLIPNGVSVMTNTSHDGRPIGVRIERDYEPVGANAGNYDQHIYLRDNGSAIIVSRPKGAGKGTAPVAAAVEERVEPPALDPLEPTAEELAARPSEEELAAEFSRLTEQMEH